LLFGQIPAMDLPRLRALSEQFPVRIIQVLAPSSQVTGHPSAQEHVYDLEGHLRQAAHAQSLQWVVVRPDAYLAASGHSGPKWRSQVTAALLKATGADT
jgi:3-(3-hydroxy-phenyl)propionate hydroxylase